MSDMTVEQAMKKLSVFLNRHMVLDDEHRALAIIKSELERLKAENADISDQMRLIRNHPQLKALQAHWCNEWDGLFVMNKCPEWDMCKCFPVEER